MSAEPAKPAEAAPADGDGSLHPLQHTWVLWFDQNIKTGKKGKKTDSQKWEENLKIVGTFRTVEDFWRYFNNIAKPTQLQDSSNYHFFKEGIKPMWEDESNKRGGKWHLTAKKAETIVDQYWENLVLAMIGEVLAADLGDDEICGAVFSRRDRGNRIALWNKNKQPDELVQKLGLRMYSVLNGNPTLEYSVHDDSLKSGAGYSNPTKWQIKNGHVMQ